MHKTSTRNWIFSTNKMMSTNNFQLELMYQFHLGTIKDASVCNTFSLYHFEKFFVWRFCLLLHFSAYLFFGFYCGLSFRALETQCFLHCTSTIIIHLYGKIVIAQDNDGRISFTDNVSYEKQKTWKKVTDRIVLDLNDFECVLLLLLWTLLKHARERERARGSVRERSVQAKRILTLLVERLFEDLRKFHIVPLVHTIHWCMHFIRVGECFNARTRCTRGTQKFTIRWIF